MYKIIKKLKYNIAKPDKQIQIEMVSNSSHSDKANELYNQILFDAEYDQIIYERDEDLKEMLYARHDALCIRQYSADFQHWSAEQFEENNAITDALLEIIVKKHGPYIVQN